MTTLGRKLSILLHLAFALETLAFVVLTAYGEAVSDGGYIKCL